MANEGRADTKNLPSLTVPQWLAFAAFVVFVVFSLIAGQKASSTVNPDEFEELRKLTLFLIGALLPSDFLIRFGRSLLFHRIENAEEGAREAPATTLPQILAFGTFLIVALLTLISNEIVDTTEFDKVNEVGRTLIIALLPSEAGIRFGRALYLRRTPRPTTAEFKRI